MRVVMLSKMVVVGAYQRKLEEIAAHPDVDLTVIVPPYWQEEVRRLDLERSHTQGYRLDVLPIARNGHFHTYFYRGLGARLRALQPDVLHIDEEAYNLATWLALRAGHRVGARPLFVTWQNIHRVYPAPFRWFEQVVYRQAAYALAANAESVEVLRAKGYAGPVAVFAQMGVDPAVFCPGEEPRFLRENGVLIGFFGRLVEQKGLLVLLDALAGLEAPWHLHLVGDGPLRLTLEARVAQAGWADRVTFNRGVPSAQMPVYLRQMDVVVLPSLTRPNWKEQFGRILIEAMSCGVPVLGSDSGEIPHVIGDGGLIAPEGDASAWRDQLARLAADPALCAALGRAGRQRVLVHYTQARVAAATVDVYRAIAGAPANP
ncbi:MAG: glycosyltransferase family 4 protein [Chloroflexi bacterium]|nr:glycosyltransferase family 4 protein [Chloroflexota bacterium]MBU1749985.1 glycosyltransferase family 4 protein [Chloroflexota bacterium]MBU1878215.1 glycosyltransferase family 4 protein [Chloroflexota bacterium]